MHRRVIYLSFKRALLDLCARRARGRNGNKSYLTKVQLFSCTLHKVPNNIRCWKYLPIGWSCARSLVTVGLKFPRFWRDTHLMPLNIPTIFVVRLTTNGTFGRHKIDDKPSLNKRSWRLRKVCLKSTLNFCKWRFKTENDVIVTFVLGTEVTFGKIRNDLFKERQQKQLSILSPLEWHPS